PARPTGPRRRATRSGRGRPCPGARAHSPASVGTGARTPNSPRGDVPTAPRPAPLAPGRERARGDAPDARPRAASQQLMVRSVALDPVAQAVLGSPYPTPNRVDGDPRGQRDLFERQAGDDLQ